MLFHSKPKGSINKNLSYSASELGHNSLLGKCAELGGVAHSPEGMNVLNAECIEGI